MAGTRWKEFEARKKLKASELNYMFDWVSGAIMPQTLGEMTTSVYDMGSSTYRWKNGYFQTVNLGGVEITGPFDEQTITNNTSGSITVKSNGTRGATANSGGSQQEIAAGTLSYPDFRDHAASNETIGSQYFTTSGTRTTITSLAITPLAGNNVLLMAHVSMQVYPVFDLSSVTSATNGACYGRVTLERNGVQVGSVSFGRYVSGNVPQTFNMMIVGMDAPGATATTYSLTYAIFYGTYNTTPYYNIAAIDLRR